MIATHWNISRFAEELAFKIRPLAFPFSFPGFGHEIPGTLRCVLEQLIVILHLFKSSRARKDLTNPGASLHMSLHPYMCGFFAKVSEISLKFFF